MSPGYFIGDHDAPTDADVVRVVAIAFEGILQARPKMSAEFLLGEQSDLSDLSHGRIGGASVVYSAARGRYGVALYWHGKVVQDLGLVIGQSRWVQANPEAPWRVKGVLTQKELERLVATIFLPRRPLLHISDVAIRYAKETVLRSHPRSE